MNLDAELLECIDEEFEPERQEKALDRFIICCEEIVNEYSEAFSPDEALCNAIEDHKEYVLLHGTNKLNELLQKFVIARLRYRCFN
jgi:hypothetical protein